MKTLLKRKSSGKVRQWDVRVEGNQVIVSYGWVNGKMTKKITRCEAKNIGRANETTPAEQAVLEAASLHKKQMDRECYVEDLNDPAPYIQPMLALDATKVGHRIKWDQTQYGQAKLDGVRGFHDPAKPNVQSRKGTMYKLDAMHQQLEELRTRLNLPKDDMYIDGEAAKIGVPLGKILGACRKPNELTEELSFFVFDLASTSGIIYEERRKILTSVTLENLKDWGLDKIKIVPAYGLTQSNLKATHDRLVIAGYEGLMIREAGSLYEFGDRSDGLFKYKEFEEDEFDVLAINPDKDGQAVITYRSPPGHHPDKPTFDSRPRGTDASRIYLVANKDFYIGKKGTVRYFALTEYGIPQFPVTVVLDPDK